MLLYFLCFIFIFTHSPCQPPSGLCKFFALMLYWMYALAVWIIKCSWNCSNIKHLSICNMILIIMMDNECRIIKHFQFGLNSWTFAEFWLFGSCHLALFPVEHSCRPTLSVNCWRYPIDKINFWQSRLLFFNSFSLCIIRAAHN